MKKITFLLTLLLSLLGSQSVKATYTIGGLSTGLDSDGNALVDGGYYRIQLPNRGDYYLEVNGNKVRPVNTGFNNAQVFKLEVSGDYVKISTISGGYFKVNDWNQGYEKILVNGTSSEAALWSIAIYSSSSKTYNILERERTSGYKYDNQDCGYVFSNYSGPGYDMGFYNDISDPGSIFKFIKVDKVPFDLSADPTSADKKYFMTLKENYCGGGTGDDLGKNLVASYDITNPNFVWAFGGDYTNGITIYNIGLAKYAKFSNTDNCVVSYVDSEDKSTFDISVYQNYFGFKVHGSTNTYLNSRSSKFSTWNSSNGTPDDAGSRFVFTQVYTVTFSEAVAVNGGSAVSTIYVPNGNTISLPIDKSYAINGGEAMTSLEAAEAIHSISGDMTITVDDQTELVWKGASFVTGGTADFYGFGIVLPDDAEDGHAYSFDKFEFYKVNKGNKSTQSYVAITKSAPSYSSDKVSATDVIAVSNNAPEYSAYSYCQYDFDNPVILKKGVTYYVQFFTSNVPVNGYYTSTYQRMGINHQTGTNSYPPGMYGADGTTRTNWTPDFRCIVEDEGTANDVTVTVNYKFGENTTSTETVNAIGGQKYEANYLKKSQWLDPADDSNLFTVINDGTTTQTVNVDLAANKSTYRLYTKRGYTGGTQSEIGSFSDSGTIVEDGTHPGALTVYNGQLTNTFMDVNYENDETKTLTPGEFALVYYNSTFYLYDVSSGKYLSHNSDNNHLITIDKYSIPNGSLTMGSSGQSTFIFKPTWTSTVSGNGNTINCTRWENHGAVVNQDGNDAGCYYKVEKVQNGTFDATEALKAFSNQYSLYETHIKPFIDNTDDDKLFFLSEEAKANVLSQAPEIEDKYCTATEYIYMKLYLGNLVNKPIAGHLFRIKNHQSGNYIAYGTAHTTSGDKDPGLIAKADNHFTDGSTVFKLEFGAIDMESGVTSYKIYSPSQSKYVGSQTSANSPFPLENVAAGSAQKFRLELSSTPGVVLIRNEESEAPNGFDGYLFEATHASWTTHGVVNWGSGADYSKWEIEQDFCIPMIDVTAVTDNSNVYMGWGNNTGFDVTFTDEGTKVYTAKACNGSTVTLTDDETEDKVVPAGEAVVLRAQDGATLNLTIAEAEASSYSNNLLKKGTGTGIVTDEEASRYILAYASDATTPLFYNLNQSYSVPENKTYLEIASGGSGARALTISFGDDIETSIETTELESLNTNAPTYDLQGRRVEKAQKGLYIVGGRKVLVK